MTYIQANFCNSMVDMDLFFLQICATQLPAYTFLTTAIDIFGVTDWLGMCPLSTPHEMEQDSMLEGLLTFLATLVTSRTNLGNSEPIQCIIEISALLATGDKTHSQLLELMPERSGNAHTRNFEKFLKELSQFRRPPIGSENLDQGLFIPVADVWEKYYDPLHVLLRAVHRRDFQNSMDRFTNYVKQEKKLPKSGTLWPPFRLPSSVSNAYSDPACILHSRILHAALLGILYRAVHSHNVSEHMLSLAIFLLEMAVTFTATDDNSTVIECGRSSAASCRDERNDLPELLNCFPGDCLSENLRHNVSRISLEPQVSPATYTSNHFDSDIEWDVSESDTLPMLVASNEVVLSSSGIGMEVALPQDLSVVREQSIVIRSNSDDINMDDVTTMSAQTQQVLPPLTYSEAVQAIAEYSPSIRRIDSGSVGGGGVVVGGGSGHLALTAAASLPESGMEVAIRRDLGLAETHHHHHHHSNAESSSRTEMFSPSSNITNSGMLLPFQRVQPVAIPNNNLDIVPTTNAASRRMHHTGGSGGIGSSGGVGSGNKKKSSDGPADSIIFDESIISLLLKLHSQLSGTLDSFSLEEEVQEMDTADLSNDEPSTSAAAASSTFTPSPNPAGDSRIGDGPYFIGNLLRKIANIDQSCARSITEIRRNLWPNQREKQAEQRARETREKEERSKRAKERQQKLMQEFANKQKKFMEMAAEGMECGDDNDDEYEEQPREKEYVCIICNRTSPSTEWNPIGLVVLVESSGVIGHRRKVGMLQMIVS